MATLYPSLENIRRLKVKPEEGELFLVQKLSAELDDLYEIFFNPYLDGDRPDIIIIKPDFAIFIIEIKDWNLDHYNVNFNNKWFVKDGKGNSSQIKSPQSQAFKYKSNLYELHLPVLGLNSIGNKAFYNIVKPYVYLHKATKNIIRDFYQYALNNLQERKRENNNKYKNNNMSYEEYSKIYDYHISKEKAINRDKKMSFGTDQLNQLIKEIKRPSNRSNIFSSDIYQDFHRRLVPPEHILKQGKEINFDKKQKKITDSLEKREKIKGVAGCGKTTILAQRAINAYERTETEVLILTYNITLRNYISERISDLQGFRRFSERFEISNYHQFFNSQANNLNIVYKEMTTKEELEELYRTDIFSEKNTNRYKTILIDEIQDFDPAWVKIIRDRFLSKNGEMVLFGDDAQDIYERNSGRAPVIAQGFGRWKTFTRSYRTTIDSPLNQTFKEFQQKFLLDQHKETEVFEANPIQDGLSFDLLKYIKIMKDNWTQTVFNEINGIIKEYDLHPNDIVILSSRIEIIRSLNEFWLQNEKTQAMFETFSEIEENTQINNNELRIWAAEKVNNELKKHQQVLEKIRRIKKTHFHSNSGLIKLSTIHSFKGFESKSVFYIIHASDSAEIIYTSITRSTQNLVIFGLDINPKYESFFMKHTR